MGCGGSKTANKYDDYDWVELPEEVRAAAEKLGYTKRIWDKDEKLAVDDKDWAELTGEEKTAAGVLGYTEENWEK